VVPFFLFCCIFLIKKSSYLEFYYSFINDAKKTKARVGKKLLQKDNLMIKKKSNNSTNRKEKRNTQTRCSF